MLRLLPAVVINRHDDLPQAMCFDRRQPPTGGLQWATARRAKRCVRCWCFCSRRRSGWAPTGIIGKKLLTPPCNRQRFLDRSRAGNERGSSRRSCVLRRHVTFAEIPPDPKSYPGALPEMIFAGSLVFTPPSRPVDLRNWGEWWTFLKGANWRRPYGPKSDINGRDNHPVVRAYLFGCRKLRLRQMGHGKITDRGRMGIRRARRTRWCRVRMGR